MIIGIYLITKIINTSSIKFYKKKCLDLIPKAIRELNFITKIPYYKMTLCKIITQCKPIWPS